MLGRFLFVGIGGSGGKTLRVLRHELQRRLREVGYEGGIPAGWQFLLIDVPHKQEDGARRLPAPLPEDAYVRLTERGISYADVDAILMSQGRDVREHVAGWRPEPGPADSDVNVLNGAGQYRALGRFVNGSAIDVVVRALRSVHSRMVQPAVIKELAAVSERLEPRTDDGAAIPPPPVVVVISSIAGGSGAGALIDVCDALRAVDPVMGESLAVLYTPDVFDELAEVNRAGVQPNSLATMSELLAAYWAGPRGGNDPAARVSQERFALLRAAISPDGLNRSGPRHPFLIGRDNPNLRFTTQVDVYLAVGRSLASWVTSRQVQDDLRQSVMTNWAQAARAVPIDNTRLAPGEEQPFSSFGHASVSLGFHDRFAEYAAGRLAGTATDIILFGHRLAESEDDASALERAVEDYLDWFVDTCRLRDDDQARQLTEDLAGGKAGAAQRDTRFDQHERSILDGLTRNRIELEADKVAAMVQGRAETLQGTAFRAEREADQEHATAWVEQVQQRVLDATAVLLGRVGAPATVEILDRVIAILLEEVSPELADRAIEEHQEGQAAWSRITATTADLPPRTRSIPTSSPLLATAVTHAVYSLWHEAQAGLYELASGLVRELAEEFLEPLRLAVKAARNRLDQEAQGLPGRPSPVDRWRQRLPSAELRPPENEFLLEPVDGYPARFSEVLQQTVGVATSGVASARAAAEVVSGAASARGDHQEVVRATTAWSPSPRLLPTEEGRQRAQVTVALAASDLYRVAEAWVRRTGTPIGTMVSTPLAAYLDTEGVQDVEHWRRLQAFRTAFTQMVVRSMPFAQIDPGALGRVHGRQRQPLKRISALPFSPQHPAAPVVMEVLREDGEMSAEDIERLFGTGEKFRIEMTTFLANPCNPVVFESLTRTISDELAQWRTQGQVSGDEFWKWRRARPLPEFVPLPDEQRLAMVRGWFVARALGQIELPKLRQPRPVRIFVPQKGMRPFPYPLLGRPVTRHPDTLPALLESLPLALIETSGPNLEPMRPYWRLAELGTLPDDDQPAVPAELDDWLAGGIVKPGADSPPARSLAATGSRDDDWKARLADVTSYLGGAKLRYGEVVERSEESLELGGPISRMWELRADIMLALAQLLDACELYRPDREPDDV
jgi:hypothetical protein